MASGNTKKHYTLKISFNSPVILTFTAICLAALILGQLTGGHTTRMFFSVYRSSLLNPLTYVRFIGHVFGHSGVSHFMGNIMLILVIGPLLEEKYGSADMIFLIVSTAIITGVVHFIFFPHVMLLGASGVAFAMILLASFTSIKDGSIPLTFILVFVLYIGEQVYDSIFVSDNISHLTHIRCILRTYRQQAAEVDKAGSRADTKKRRTSIKKHVQIAHAFFLPKFIFLHFAVLYAEGCILLICHIVEV